MAFVTWSDFFMLFVVTVFVFLFFCLGVFKLLVCLFVCLFVCLLVLRFLLSLLQAIWDQPSIQLYDYQFQYATYRVVSVVIRQPGHFASAWVLFDRSRDPSVVLFDSMGSRVTRKSWSEFWKHSKRTIAHMLLEKQV